MMHMSRPCIRTGGLKRGICEVTCIAGPFSVMSVIKAQAMQCYIIPVMLHNLMIALEAINFHQAKKPLSISMKSRFLTWWTLNFDLDLQGRPQGHSCPSSDQILGPLC